MKQDPYDVLLCVTKLRPDERLLLDALRAQGLSVATALAPDVGDVLNGKARPPRVALMRNLSHREAAGLAHRLEQRGVETVNTTYAIDLCHDKGKQSLLFERSRVPHPRSYHAFNQRQVGELAADLGWPVVLKPLSGSWGRGVVRLSDDECMHAWAGGCESTDVNGRMFPVLVQEYVDKPGHDIRVVVVGREPVVAFTRTSPDWRTNTHLGATVRSTEITPRLRELCARTVDLLGSGFYGIDLVEDPAGNLMVLEINANPEFAKSSAEHGVDVAGFLAAYVADRSHGRRAA